MRILACLVAMPGAGCTLLLDLDPSDIRRPDAYSPEICDDGVPNTDGDELADCGDPDCAEHETCEVSPAACSDLADNDGDDAVDCGDSDCVEACTERGARCADGRDNDSNALVDCEEWACFGTLACLPRTTVIGPKPCGLIDQQPFLDVFESLGRWIQDGSVSLSPGRLELTDGSITSTVPYRIGSGFESSLTFGLVPRSTSCAAVDRCRVEMGFGTVVAPLLAVALESDGEELVARCLYHGRPIGASSTFRHRSFARLTVSFATKAPRVRLQGASVSGELTGIDVCRPELDPIEPPAPVFATSARPDGPGGTDLDLTHVSLQVDDAVETPACRTLGVFAPCPDTLRVAKGPGEYRALVRALGRDEIFAFTSTSGRTWTPFERRLSGPYELGALLYNSGADRFETWIREPSGQVFRVTSSRGATAWGGIEERADFFPEAAAVRELTYRAFVERLGGDGRTAIHGATSADGLSWMVSEEPALAAGPREAWDVEGVDNPAVSDAGDLWLMTYGAAAFGGRHQIGIAVSGDGVHWIRHVSNPVSRADNVGHDDRGAFDATVLLEGDALSMWYRGVSGLCGDLFGPIELEPSPSR
jgi:hypothetical protein